MITRVSKTALGALIGIQDAIEKINIEEQDVEGIVHKQMSVELPGMLKIYLDNNIGKINIEEQKVKSIVQDQISAKLPEMLENCLKNKPHQQQKEENPTVDINSIVTGWLLFNLYGLLKEHSDNCEITGLANQFAEKFCTTDEQLRHQPLATFIQDFDALTKIMNVINETVPTFLKAYPKAESE